MASKKTPQEWSDVMSSNSEELLCLKNLSMLSISLKNSHALQRLLSSNRLQSCTQSLCLQDLSHPKTIKVSLTDLKHLNTLKISKCEYLEELEVDFGIVSPCSFYLLGEVIIYSCPKLRDMTWLIMAPNLKHLEISDCDEMEEIINGGKLSERPERMGKVITFSKLKFLTLKHLPKLRSIYWSDLPFPDLKELVITDCPMLLPLPPHLLNKVHVLPVEPSSVENPADRAKQVIESGKSLEVPSKSDSGSEKKHIKGRFAFTTTNYIISKNKYGH
ncbi:hypothetical protein LWI29_013557 [Acer saccharum]|uniref:Disease resistance protein At4g27190-like leucine-rich repeats domain-containing protein n=1 Tax=Acer saccharum TaxID=4024 RepID=A0AA39T1Z1_ACESA|nr:hypothetical protein LWI29_013557 [Acer saccharum]